MTIIEKDADWNFFGSLQVGDVFKFRNSYYMKIEPIIELDEVNDEKWERTACRLSDGTLDLFGDGEKIVAVKAKLVIEG